MTHDKEFEVPKRAKVDECNAEMVWDIANLALAHSNAKKGKAFYKEVQMVDANQSKFLYELQEMEISGNYKTSKYERFVKHDGTKVREIYKLPYYPDRIHQWAIIQVIEPYLLRNFTDDTYSAIPGRGTYAAYKAVNKALRGDPEGTQWCLQIDVKKYYPSINKERLKYAFERLFKDKRLLEMIYEIIDSTDEDVGVPIGNYISQYSGNLYLSVFDHYVKEHMHVRHYFRYMDDMVFFAKTKKELQRIVRAAVKFLHDVLDLVVKDSWSLFFVEHRGVNFIGYVFRHKVIRLRKNIVKTLRRLSLKIKRRVNKGMLINYSMFCGIGSLKGWLEHCDGGGLWVKYISVIEMHIQHFYDVVIKPKKKGALRCNC